jgi:hypothetical protein
MPADEHADLRLLARDDATQIPHLGDINLAGLDREDDLLGGRTLLLVKVESPVDAPISTLLLSGILKRFDLRGSTRPILFREQHIVVAIAVERWIKVDQKHGFVLDVPAEDVQVVAVVQAVGLGHVAPSAGRLLRFRAV